MRAEVDRRYFSAHSRPEILRVVSRLWRHLDLRRRRQLRALGVLILVGGMSEALTGTSPML